MKIDIDVKILNPKIKHHLPTYGSIGSAGLDLRACIDEELIIPPNETILIPTGLPSILKIQIMRPVYFLGRVWVINMVLC